RAPARSAASAAMRAIPARPGGAHRGARGRGVRRRFPEVALVVDIDDLLSRRFDEMLERRLPLSLGYLDGTLPRQVARMTASSMLARAVLRYERMALRHAEREVMRLADRVVLVNRHEANLLAEASAAWRGRRRACASIEVI